MTEFDVVAETGSLDTVGAVTSSISMTVEKKHFFEIMVAGNLFILPAECYCEVIVESSIASLPNSPEYLMGLCNLRGVLIPVYQWHSQFQATLPKKKIIICIGRAEQSVGLLIDKLPTTKHIAMTQLIADESVSASQTQSLVNQYYLHDGKRIGLIDPAEIGNRFLSTANKLKSQM